VGALVGAALAWGLSGRAVQMDAVSVLITVGFCAAVGLLAGAVGRLAARGVRRPLWRVLLAVVLIPPALFVCGDLLYSILVKRSYALAENDIKRDADGVRDGWREYTVGKGETALLMIHGFANSPVMFKRMAPALADKGYTCEVMRLPGSGEPFEAADRVTADDCVRAVRTRLEALGKSHKRVVVVAHSMGAAVAVACLTERPDLADGLALLAPMIEVSSRRSPLLSPEAWSRILDRALLFTDRFWMPLAPDMNDPEGALIIQGERFMPKSSSRVLFDLIGRNRGRATSFRMPLLMLLAPDDPVIDNAAARRFFDDCPGEPKRLHVLERSNHNLPLDYDWAEAVDEVSRFARDLPER
jgi:esterase/lipase